MHESATTNVIIGMNIWSEQPNKNIGRYSNIYGLSVCFIFCLVRVVPLNTILSYIVTIKITVFYNFHWAGCKKKITQMYLKWIFYTSKLTINLWS